jgi:CRISPR system Cascade subunit CasD
MDVLILRLQGPLMAFGDTAVDELRPTDLLPGLSLMTGLLGNALGWLYLHGDRLQSLQDRLLLASRLERRGSLLRDYQNAHINKGDKLWRSKGGPLGRDMGSAGESIVQRERFYRANAAVTAALALEPPGGEPSLDDLERALRRPARPLFLGRMSCPPSVPIYQGERMRAGSLEEALLLAPPLPGPSPGEEESSWLMEYPLKDVSSAPDALERQDLRDWRNGVHAGSRFVRRCLRPREEQP